MINYTCGCDRDHDHARSNTFPGAAIVEAKAKDKAKFALKAKAKAKAKGKALSSLPALRRGSADDLPQGWRIISKVRQSGASKGVVDKYYTSPDGVQYDSLVKAKAAAAKT